MKSFAIRAVGNHRNAPRIYLYGADTQRAGFKPGLRYSIEKQEGEKCLILKLNSTGDRVVSIKRRGEKELGVIDINSREVLAMFDGLSSVRVISTQNAIYIQPTDTQSRKIERELRLRAELEQGLLTTASISHGAGILDYAMHQGLELAGFHPKLMFANEIRDELLDNASEFNPIWNEDTVYIAAPMQEIAFDRHATQMIKPVSILSSGIPCSGASTAGRAAKGTAFPEQHEHVGHLIVSYLALVARLNPFLLKFENVNAYENSASMAILKTTLKEWGYDVHTTTIDSSDFNSMEKRKRMCMIAVTSGCDFSWDWLNKPEPVVLRLGDYLDHVPQGDPRWRDYASMKDKEVRDAAKGNSFKMQIFDENSGHVNVLTKGVSKIRSTDPKLASPYGDGLIREFTPAEHARFKSVNYSLVSDMSNTNQHEALGQSICTPGFVAVARDCIGEVLRRFQGGNKLVNVAKDEVVSVSNTSVLPAANDSVSIDADDVKHRVVEQQLSLFA